LDPLGRRVWGQYGVNVNTVAPAMQTVLVDGLMNAGGEAARAEADAALRDKVPIDGRHGDPARDLVPVFLFLAGPAARFVTGQLIPVDGGFMMVGA
jgi:NAD(P)-dependent dehydrogenase (short-subunit alcohol dehydrogenase family)